MFIFNLNELIDCRLFYLVIMMLGNVIYGIISNSKFLFKSFDCKKRKVKLKIIIFRVLSNRLKLLTFEVFY